MPSRRNQRGPNNPNWKGGVVRVIDGRTAIYCPGHPEATLFGGTHALRYRIVAAETIGRPLRKDEIVHHINGDPTDDRPENLEVTTRPPHSRQHLASRRDPNTGRMLPKGAPVVLAADRRKPCVACGELFLPKPKRTVRQKCCGPACVRVRQRASRLPSHSSEKSV